MPVSIETTILEITDLVAKTIKNDDLQAFLVALNLERSQYHELALTQYQKLAN